MKADLCPVCNGKGVIYGVAESGAYPTTTCYGCNGKGWVEVSESDYNPIKELNWEYPNLLVQPFVDKCPACGGDRNSPGGTGCPKGSHYGTYCSVISNY